MYIEHIALYVNDLEAAREFFTHYFSARSNEQYHNSTSNFRSYFLSFDSGTRLELMTRPQLVDSAKDEYRTGYAHLSFSLGSKAAVDELTQRMVNDGYELLSGPRTTGDGYYESCICGFENNIIELTV